MKATIDYLIQALFAYIPLMLVSAVVYASADETWSEEYSNVETIRLENISIKISINTHDKDITQVKVIGPKQEHHIIRALKNDNELIITQTESLSSVGDVSVITHTGSGNSSSRSVVTIGNKTTVIEGNGVVVSHSNLDPRIYMEILIPAGTPLSLIDFTGKANLGDLQSTFFMQGSGKVFAGSLAEVDLDIYKNAKVEIENVKDFIYVQASGNSKLKLKQGSVEEIQAEISGNSRVKFQGHAEKGKFNITDNGKLFISSVQERSTPKLERNGRLIVGNW